MSSASTPRIPSYRLHKPKGLAVVTIDGRDQYLGKWSKSPNAPSRQEYDRVISEWLARGRTAPQIGDDLNVDELVVRFLDWAKTYYRGHDNKETTELHLFKSAAKPLKQLYGDTPILDFGPLKLSAVRDRMIKLGWTRKSINKQIGRIRRIWKWAVSKELADKDKLANVLVSLGALEGLKLGRTRAAESEPITPVAKDVLRKTRRHCSPVVRAMMDVQLLGFMRPEEVCRMRPCDVDRSGTVWTYEPPYHKNAYREQDRPIWLGRHAQRILKQFWPEDESAYVFSPEKSAKWHRDQRHAKRRIKSWYGNHPGSNRVLKPKRRPGKRFTTATYGRAIRRACEKAGVDAFGPNRLRHLAATRGRVRYGLEAVQVLLGHKHASISEIYAAKNTSLAKKIIAEIG
jgi:integrase